MSAKACAEKIGPSCNPMNWIVGPRLLRPAAIEVGAVGELVGIDGGVVSGVINLELSGAEASDWRPRHGERYHEA